MIIIKGGSRCNGAYFAKHLVNPDQNETVKVAELRGLAARNIGQALFEMKAVASGTRCKEFFYHASINPERDEILTPEQWEHAVDELEKRLDLEGQARFVVEHEKKGRTHRHVVWSRIDVDRMRAIRMDYDYAKHQAVARQLEQEFGLRPGRSVIGPEVEKGKRPDRRPKSWEVYRGQEVGMDVTAMKKEITSLWQSTSSAEAFVSALEARGYILARGDKQDFCIVDSLGQAHSLPRRIKGVKTSEIKERLSPTFAPQDLPRVKEATAIQLQKIKQGHEQEEQERSATPKGADVRQQDIIQEEDDRQQQAVQEAEQRQQVVLDEEQRREEFSKQAERQVEQAHEMEAQQERLDQYKEAMASYAARARQEEAERRQRQELDARIRERGEIRNAHHRYGEALGQHYSVRDPYESLARAAMAEYAAFLRERSKLDAEIAKTSDPLERRRMELRKDVEAAEYMAVTSERIAGQSEIIVGKMNSPEAVKERARAKAFKAEAEKLREEYRKVGIEQERGAEPQGGTPHPAEHQGKPSRHEESREQGTRQQEDPKKEPGEKPERADQAAKEEQTKEEQKRTTENQKSAETPLMVEERSPGKVAGPAQTLGEYVRTLPEKEPTRTWTAQEIKADPAARRAYYAQLAQEKNRQIALDNISRTMKAGKNLNTDDVRRLSREDLDGIKRNGDKHLKEVVQQHEKDREKDRGLER